MQSQHFPSPNKYWQTLPFWYTQILWLNYITSDASDVAVVQRRHAIARLTMSFWQYMPPHFRHNLEGRNFFVDTDHKPLTFVMSSVTERPSLRQTRHSAFIAEFTTDIRYIKGETNFVADAQCP